MENKYTFRKLNSTDTFLMFKILGKIGVNEIDIEDLTNMLTSKKGKDKTQLVGISVILEIANIVLNNLPKCENEVYQMLSNVSGMSVDEIKALDMVDFAEMIIEFIKKEEFKDFIKVVSRLFKSEN